MGDLLGGKLEQNKRRALNDRITFNLEKRSRNDDPRQKDDRFHKDQRSILMEIKGHPMLRKPRPLSTPQQLRDQSKFCEYHEENGHTTGECRDLKKALHELAD